MGAVLEVPTAAHINQRQVEGEATNIREIFTEEMVFTAGFTRYMRVCQAAIIGSRPDFYDCSVQLLGGLEAWSLPTGGFLEKTGHVHPTARQWGERARKGWCSAECIEGSGRRK